MRVLILSSEEDNHAIAVCNHLSELAVPFSFFQPADVLTDWRFHFRSHENGDWSRVFSKESQPQATLELSDFSAFWLRRVGAVKSPPMPEQWIEEFVSWETSRALDGILHSAKGLWVNDPNAERLSLVKVRQLQLAQTAGLNVPDTLVTNAPEEAREFIELYDGQVIYKPIDERSVRYIPMHELPRGIPTTPVRNADISHLGQVSTCAHLFQRKIAKTADIRVTAVGRKLFAAKIFSQEGAGRVDFRLDFSVPIEPHVLPAELEQQCLSLMQALGLTFGAFDLGLDSDGRYWFFEINPAGQWLWIENETSLPISRELALLLAGRTDPLVQ